MYKLMGIMILLFMAAVFAWMIWTYITEAKIEARKEERQDARAWGLEIARREYKRLVDNTEFKVKQALVISNESDIKW